MSVALHRCPSQSELSRVVLHRANTLVSRAVHLHTVPCTSDGPCTKWLSTAIWQPNVGSTVRAEVYCCPHAFEQFLACAIMSPPSRPLLRCREPGRVHCMSLPVMVKSVAATISYNQTNCDSVNKPRTEDPNQGDAGEVPEPELTAREQGLFSRLGRAYAGAALSMQRGTRGGEGECVCVCAHGPLVVCIGWLLQGVEEEAGTSCQAVRREGHKCPTPARIPSLNAHEQIT